MPCGQIRHCEMTHALVIPTVPQQCSVFLGVTQRPVRRSAWGSIIAVVVHYDPECGSLRLRQNGPDGPGQEFLLVLRGGDEDIIPDATGVRFTVQSISSTDLYLRPLPKNAFKVMKSYLKRLRKKFVPRLTKLLQWDINPPTLTHIWVPYTVHQPMWRYSSG